MAKKDKQPKQPKVSKIVPICACPSGARAVVNPKTRKLVCSLGGQPVKKVCSNTLRQYTVAPKITVSNELERPDAYSYSTPSGVVEIGPAARKASGCLVEHVPGFAKRATKTLNKGDPTIKKIKLPYRCPPDSKQHEKSGTCVDEEGRSVAPIADESCGDTAKPCSTGRTTCPVQLVYRKGRPALRFCPPFVWKVDKKGERRRAGSKEPGWLVPVDSPVKAHDLAARACARWQEDGQQFTSENPAAVEARKARIGYAGTGEDEHTLGGLGAARAFRRARWRR